MRGVARGLRLWGAFLRASLLAEAQYRANFWTDALVSLTSLGWTLAAVSLFFAHTQELAGWRREELWVVVGLYQGAVGFIEVFLRPNLGRLVDYIRLGTLDLILTKPVDAQLHVSLRHLQLWKGSDFVAGGLLALYALRRLDLDLAAWQWALAASLLASGLVLLYSLLLILVTLSFWLVQVENLMHLLLALSETARYPVQIYRGWLRALLTFAVPVGFVTTVPAEALLGRLEPRTALLGWGLAALFFALASAFWRLAIRSYTSASS